MKKDFYLHETSTIGENTSIGVGTSIWQFCTIMGGVKIGKDCNIGQGVFIEKGVQIGNYVKIKNGISIYSGVTIEDDVFLGPNCVFTNVINPRSFIERKTEFKPTLVKKGASIGANATIVCGNTIGEYALIGAGSVVVKDVSPYELVVGCPAKPIGYVCKCGERLQQQKDKWICEKCETGYYYDELEKQLEPIK